MTEDEYMNLLDRVVKGANYLANPLLKRDEKDKAMKLYDALVEEVTKDQLWRKTHG